MKPLTLVLAVVSMLGAAGHAKAGAYSCDVPRALLCQGCAQALSISLAPDGSCRITFTPSGEASPSAQALPFRFEVFTPAPRPLRARVAWRPRPPASSGKCFVFNGNQYCE